MKLSKLIEALQKIIAKEPDMANKTIGYIAIGMIEAILDRRLVQ